MQFETSDRVAALKAQLQDFMDTHVVPADDEYHRIAAQGRYPEALIDGLKDRARAAGLWNMFLPGLTDNEPGTRCTNVEYAPLAEVMGRYPWASEVFNCSAPDTGNMEILHMFATPEQRALWLDPLMSGQIRSTVGITEPDVASSDPTNLQTTITRDGDEYVITGRKWWNTGAKHPKFRFVLVMGISDPSPDAPRHARHSFVIVPTDAPGFEVVRDLPVLGHHAPEGHCEIAFDRVRVPAANLLGDEGAGFALAQARLGPGRIHHCMRTIGQCERALELMCDRALARETYGRPLSDNANIRDWIAEARIEIEQARLLALYAAWMMDTHGNRAAKTLVSQIKVAAARLQTKVCDRAMQVWGAAGLSDDTPLAFLYSWGRALRYVDGPDEVHLRGIARAELKAAEARASDAPAAAAE